MKPAPPVTTILPLLCSTCAVCPSRAGPKFPPGLEDVEHRQTRDERSDLPSVWASAHHLTDLGTHERGGTTRAPCAIRTWSRSSSQAWPAVYHPSAPLQLHVRRFQPEEHDWVKHACRELWMRGHAAHQAQHMPWGLDGTYVREGGQCLRE